MFNSPPSREGGNLKPPVVYVIIALAVLAGGYLVHAAWSSGHQPLKRTMQCMTKGCTYQRKRLPELGEIIPSRCPECGKNSVVPTQKCSGCSAPVILNVRDTNTLR